MNKIRVALLSTAMLVGMNQMVHADYTQDQLETLRELTEDSDTGALAQFLEANPGLLTGSDPLAFALREFQESRSGLLGGIFGPQKPDLSNVPNLPVSVVSSAEVNFGSLGSFGS